MIWFAVVLLSILAMLPFWISIERESRSPGRRDAALTLHRGQLAELERDLADGQLDPQEHAAAALEIQRRILAVDDDQEIAPVAKARASLLIALAVLPLIALTLYLAGGSPDLPSIPRNELVAEPVARAGVAGQTLATLRSHVATLDPHSAEARSTFVMIGKAEADRGDMSAAATAWISALQIGFDPALAAVAAEALTEAAGYVNHQAAALFRRALAGAPADAPWRSMVEKRLSESAQDTAPRRTSSAASP